MALPSVIRGAVRGFLALIVALIFLGLPAALAWVRFVGIGMGVPERISRELSRGELEVLVGKVAFDVFQGFVARDVQVREKSSGRRVARLSRVAVTPRLAGLLRGKISIERLALAGAEGEFRMTSGNAGGQTLRISHLEGDAWLMEDHLRIPHLRGSVQGVRLEADALITIAATEPRAQYPASSSPPSEDRHQQLLLRLLEEFDKIKFHGTPPALKVSIRGTTSRLAAESFEFRCGQVRGPGWSLESVEAGGSWDGSDGQLDRLEIRDAEGRLKLWGALRNGRADFEGAGNLAPAQWLQIFAPKIAGDWNFPRAPEITFQGRWDFGSPGGAPVVSGSLNARDFRFRGAKVDSLSTGFAWKPGVFLAREMRIEAGGGQMRADVLRDGGGIRARLASLVRPDVFAPALDDKLRATLALFEFRDTPAFEIVLKGPTPADLEGGGHLRLGRTAMRGVWVDGIESAVSISRGAVTYQDFVVKKASSRATGTFTYDFRNQLVRLRNITSDLQPAEVLMWADPRIAESVRPYRFVEGPRVKANGVVYMRETARNDLDLAVDAPRGLDYDLLGKTLRFERVAATLRLDGANLRVSVPKAALMGGGVTLNASVSLDPADPEWSAEVRGRALDFPSLTRLYFGYDGSGGVASGQYAFRSVLGRELDMTGHGWVRVEDGNVFAIPLFGPLSEIISKILPGVGYETARLAAADFEISGRKVRTRNLAIEGKGFSLYGEGDIGFPSGAMDMSIRINARGIPGYIFFPVSKLFEYVSDGTFSDPRWRPKIIPRLPLPGAGSRR